MEILKAGQIVGEVKKDGVIPARVVLNPRDGKFLDRGGYMVIMPPSVQLVLPQFSHLLSPESNLAAQKQEVSNSSGTTRQNFMERIRYAMSDLISQRRI